MIENKVFNDYYLRQYIFSFLFYKKCLSCKSNLNNKILEFKFLNHRNKELMNSMYRNSNKGNLKGVYVCNWCYYYVWGIR
jgi:hypothetical protein